jgi:hypothetical protein
MQRKQLAHSASAPALQSRHEPPTLAPLTNKGRYTLSSITLLQSDDLRTPNRDRERPESAGPRYAHIPSPSPECGCERPALHARPHYPPEPVARIPKPVSAYVLFCKQQRAVTNEYAHTPRLSKLAEEWINLSADQRLAYEDKAFSLAHAYKEEVKRVSPVYNLHDHLPHDPLPHPERRGVVKDTNLMRLGKVRQTAPDMTAWTKEDFERALDFPKDHAKPRVAAAWRDIVETDLFKAQTAHVSTVNFAQIQSKKMSSHLAQFASKAVLKELEDKSHQSEAVPGPGAYKVLHERRDARSTK